MTNTDVFSILFFRKITQFMIYKLELFRYNI